LIDQVGINADFTVQYLGKRKTGKKNEQQYFMHQSSF
jgi:hypothetical protein